MLSVGSKLYLIGTLFNTFILKVESLSVVKNKSEITKNPVKLTYSL